jgi:hypothetical protein
VVILVIEPFIYWTLLGLLVANLIAAVLKTWVLRRTIRAQDVPRELLLRAAALLSERIPCADSECRLADDGVAMKCYDELLAAATRKDTP